MSGTDVAKRPSCVTNYGTDQALSKIACQFVNGSNGEAKTTKHVGIGGFGNEQECIGFFRT